MTRRASNRPLPTVPVTYWLTRDLEHGVLSEFVDVWYQKPDATHPHPGNVAWFDSTPTGLGMRYARCTAAHVATWGHAIPETERECIRVETMGYVQT